MSDCTLLRAENLPQAWKSNIQLSASHLRNEHPTSQDYSLFGGGFLYLFVFKQKDRCLYIKE